MGGSVMAQYTQKAIIETFEKMLIEMPFDKITVSALVRRCEISSNTFYYHYKSKGVSVKCEQVKPLF